MTRCFCTRGSNNASCIFEVLDRVKWSKWPVLLAKISAIERACKTASSVLVTNILAIFETKCDSDELKIFFWLRCLSLVMAQLCLRKPPSVYISVDNQTIKAVTNINKFVTIISKMSRTFGCQHSVFTKITFTLVTCSISQIRVSKTKNLKRFEGGAKE